MPSPISERGGNGMSDWSISRRINVLAGVLVGALLAIALVGLFSTLRLAASFESYRATSKQSMEIGAALEDALEARVAEVHFRLDGDPGDIAEVDSNLEEIRNGVRSLVDARGLPPDDLRRLESLVTGVGAYEDALDAASALQADLDRAIADLTEAGTATGAAIAALTDDLANGDGATEPSSSTGC